MTSQMIVEYNGVHSLSYTFFLKVIMRDYRGLLIVCVNQRLEPISKMIPRWVHSRLLIQGRYTGMSSGTASLGHFRGV